MPVKKVTDTIKEAANIAKKTTAQVKSTAGKTTVKVKKVAAKVATETKTQVAANARHINENATEIKNNSKMIHILYGTIIILMMIIAGLAFYVGQMMGTKNAPIVNTPAVVSAEEITVTIIDDSRCTDCQTSAIADQLKVLPFLAGASFVEQDFSDSGVSKFLEDNDIIALPVVIFNSNTMNDGGQITPYLTALPDGQFSLALGATFNPFAERSKNGFLIIDEGVLTGVQADAHYKGDAEAKITWLEYTDVNCHYCKKMEEDGTAASVMEAIGTDLNKTSSNFIGVGGAASQDAAEILECAASLNGSDVYNALLSETLSSGDNSKSTLIANAVAQGVDEVALNSCFDSGDAKEIVERKFTRGQNDFGITGTPGNVIINNETGEYEIISGAYPASTFEDVITRMLAE